MRELAALSCLTITAASAALAITGPRDGAHEAIIRTTDPLPAEARAQRFQLGDAHAVDARISLTPRRSLLRAGAADTFLGDHFASQVLAENSSIALLIDDPNKNDFIFNGAFQDAGEHFFTDAPTSVAAFLDPLGGGTVYQITVASVTDDASDWLPADTIFQGLPLTTIRMDMGMFTADFFQVLGADAPIQPTNNADVEVLSAAFALFAGNQFLGSAPLAFGNFSNGVAGVAAVGGAAGAGITEVQMAFVVRINAGEPPLECPPPAALTVWPPNNKFVEIDLAEVVAFDAPDGAEVDFEILSITQDEPVGPDGCDAEGVGASVASIRAQRAGWGNGRVYTINYRATAGDSDCEGVVTVSVPHDQSGSQDAIDDGQDYESDVCSAPGDINLDGRVDAVDLTHLLAQWSDAAPQAGGPVRTADLTEDGRVNGRDLLVMLAHYGWTAEAP